MRQTLSRRATLCAIAALGGCSVLPSRPYESRRDWPLEARRPATRPPNPRGQILMIRSLRAGPGLSTRALQTIQQDGSIDTALWDEWAVPPGEAIEAALRLWLSQSGLYAAVIEPGSRLTPSLIIEGDLTDFVADCRAHTSRASLSIVLLHHAGGQTLPIWQKEFTGQATLRSNSGADVADSLTKALAETLEQIENTLKEAVLF